MQFKRTCISVIYTVPPGLDFKVEGTLFKSSEETRPNQLKGASFYEKLINGLLTQ